MTPFVPFSLLASRLYLPSKVSTCYPFYGLAYRLRFAYLRSLTRSITLLVGCVSASRILGIAQLIWNWNTLTLFSLTYYSGQTSAILIFNEHCSRESLRGNYSIFCNSLLHSNSSTRLRNLPNVHWLHLIPHAVITLHLLRSAQAIWLLFWVVSIFIWFPAALKFHKFLAWRWTGLACPGLQCSFSTMELLLPLFLQWIYGI